MLESLRNRRILVVVAHPDDEILGIGATIYRLVQDYDCIARALILGEGITSRSENRDLDVWNKTLLKHKQNIIDATQAVGYDSFVTHDFPDNRFDSVDLLNIIKVVEKEKKAFNADYIFTHHGGDVNIDHQKTFEAVITATRPMADEKVCGTITFETMSGTEWRASSDPRHFIPNLFMEISQDGLEAKIKAMESYEFEKRTYPHPRSPEALTIRAKMWGIANGVRMAEAFQLIRLIEKL